MRSLNRQRSLQLHRDRIHPWLRSSRQARVLLVDDDARLVHIVSLYLESQGFDVLTAATGEAAVVLLEGRLPDLVILDIVLPGLDGLNVCRRLRALRGGRHLPILVITALTDSDDVEKAMAAAPTASSPSPSTSPDWGPRWWRSSPRRRPPEASPSGFRGRSQAATGERRRSRHNSATHDVPPRDVSVMSCQVTSVTVRDAMRANQRPTTA